MARRKQKKIKPVDITVLAPDAAVAIIESDKQAIKDDVGFYVTQYHQISHGRRDYFSIGTEDL